MSRLWRNRLRIALTPDQVSAVLLTHGRNPSLEKKFSWTCKPETSDMQTWQAALRALAVGLEELKVENMRVSFVLSNHFVRYALLPWSDDVTRTDERQALAGINFEKTFGSIARQWSIRLSDEEYGKASLASAVDASLLESISLVCNAAMLRLTSIEPYLMSVFNQYRLRLARQSICVAVVEDQKVALLMARTDQWHAVRVLPLRRSSPEELPAIVKREILLAGLPAPVQCYLHAPTASALALLPDREMPSEVLELPAASGFSPSVDLAYGMAMSGAI